MPKIVPIKILKTMKEEYEILKLGNPILRLTAKEVSKEEILSENIQNLIDDMWNVMEKAGGIGLAAPQIGISIQLAVIKLESSSDRYENLEDSEEFIIFNPELEVINSEKQGFWEGCLSVPGLRGYVKRPKKLKISYLNEKAEKKEVIVEDFLATVFQHELDHLFGYLYVDRLDSTKDLVFEDELVNITKDKILD
jgi:peptide deformylase|tara:strand:+ start:868 stop:1452 length:585 start_codon:yes stop_codon:yes gene_type:complete